MKKSIITLLALLALTLAGCEDKDIREDAGFDRYDCITTAEYNGHSYIIYKGYSKGGITHDPDCPCREKGIDICVWRSFSANHGYHYQIVRDNDWDNEIVQPVCAGRSYEQSLLDAISVALELIKKEE